MIVHAIEGDGGSIRSPTNCCLKRSFLLSLRGAKRRGNPPVRGEMFRIAPCVVGTAALFGGNRSLVPFIWGIATTSVRTGLAMTEFFQTTIYRTDGKNRECELTPGGNRGRIW